MSSRPTHKAAARRARHEAEARAEQAATVQTSSYASLFGIPVALLGLVTYVLILISLRSTRENGLLAGYVLTLIGFGFSVYPTYREVFTIHAICSWCVSSAIVFTLLAIVGTLRVVRTREDSAWIATEPV